jgi:hypothetical protein
LYVVESALLPLQKIAFRKCKQCINASSGLLMLTFPLESFVNAILKFIRKEFQSLVGYTQKEFVTSTMTPASLPLEYDFLQKCVHES